MANGSYLYVRVGTVPLVLDRSRSLTDSKPANQIEAYINRESADPLLCSLTTPPPQLLEEMVVVQGRFSLRYLFMRPLKSGVDDQRGDQSLGSPWGALPQVCDIHRLADSIPLKFSLCLLRIKTGAAM